MEEFENYQAIIKRLESIVGERYDLENALREAEIALVEKLVEKKAYYPHCDLDIQNNAYVRSAKCILQAEDDYYIHEIQDAKIVNGHFEPVDEDDMLAFIEGDEYLLSDILTGEEVGRVKMIGVFDFKVIERGNVEWYYCLEDLCRD